MLNGQIIKKIQRKLVNKRLQNLDGLPTHSKAIAQKVLGIDRYKQAKSVMVYLALPTEVDTKDIVEHALISKDTVCVPVTKEQIRLVAIDQSTRFEPAKYNVPEPTSGKEIGYVDVAIIPMVGFDKRCNRLGHGKGYFDRFLQDKNCFKIGLALEKQKFCRLSVNQNDIKMDIVITEKAIYYKDS